MTNMRSLALVLTLLAGGCVSYVQTDLADVQPQDKVRLELDQQQLTELITFADPATRTVTGRLVNTTADSIAIVLQTPAAYTQVSIPRRSVLGVQRGEADKKKNVIFSVVAVGAVAALAVAGFEGRDQSTPGDDSGIDEAIVQLFGFSIPFSLGIGR